jgi:hypothetical protein
MTKEQKKLYSNIENLKNLLNTEYELGIWSRYSPSEINEFETELLKNETELNNLLNKTN